MQSKVILSVNNYTNEKLKLSQSFKWVRQSLNHKRSHRCRRYCMQIRYTPTELKVTKLLK